MKLLAFNNQNTALKIRLSSDGEDFIFEGFTPYPLYKSVYLHSEQTLAQQLKVRIEQQGFDPTTFNYITYS